MPASSTPATASCPFSQRSVSKRSILRSRCPSDLFSNRRFAIDARMARAPARPSARKISSRLASSGLRSMTYRWCNSLSDSRVMLKVRQGQLGDFARLCGEYLKLACNKMHLRRHRSMASLSPPFCGNPPGGRSLKDANLRRGAHASRVNPRLTGKPGRFAFSEVPHPLVPRRPRLGIEAANQGGPHERKAIPMSPQSNRTSARQDIYAEITSQLVAAIEADPGKPSLPWRKSSGALFMPVNALTKNAYNGINVVSLWVAAEVKELHFARLGNLQAVARARRAGPQG